MIVQPPDRPTRAGGARANRELAVGLVALAMLSAILLHYALGYACRQRTGWPCRPSDAGDVGAVATVTVAAAGPAAVPFLPTAPGPGAAPSGVLATPPAVLSTATDLALPSGLEGLVGPTVTVPPRFELAPPPAGDDSGGAVDAPPIPTTRSTSSLPTVPAVWPTASGYPGTTVRPDETADLGTAYP